MQEIQIASRAVGLLRPHMKKHRALEHEAIPDAGGSKAVEEALEAVAREEGLVIVPGLLRAVEEARGNGSPKVGLLAGHAIASR